MQVSNRIARTTITIITLLLSLWRMFPQVGDTGQSELVLSQSISNNKRIVLAAAPERAELEARILTSTVFIELGGWLQHEDGTVTRLNKSVGHGTVVDGRHVITHNHYTLPLDAFQDGRILGTVSVRRANGELLLSKASLRFLRVAAVEAQTVVLALETADGRGLFEAADVPPAAFRDWRDLPLEAGAEVAQVNWDGQRTFVEWVRVDALQMDEGIPRVEVANYNELGSSGGGLFWNGTHIGNNWRRIRTVEASGEVSRLFSLVALNPPHLNELTSP